MENGQGDHRFTTPLIIPRQVEQQKFIKKSQNRRNQGFPYYFCLMMERSGVRSPLALWLVFRIRIHKFLGLPDLDPLVRGMDPDPALDPDPSVIKLNSKKSAWFLLFCDFFFIFYVSVTSKSKKQKNFFLTFFFKFYDENSRIRIRIQIFSQRHGSGSTA
jgi:hypothetical protein